MGTLLDMLPEMQAEARAIDHVRRIREFTGCVRLGCTLAMLNIVQHLATVVYHNRESRSFPYVMGRHRHSGMVVVLGDRGEPIALMSFEMADWIEGPWNRAYRLERKRLLQEDARDKARKDFGKSP